MSFGVAPSLPREFVAAMDRAPIGIRFGSCSAAVYLSRQVTVADIETDALWEFRREAARACAAARRLVRAHRRLGRPGAWAPSRSISGSPACRRARDHELMSRMAQIAGIAIERRGAEDALRDSEAKFRGLFESVMEGVYRTTRDGRILVANPAFVQLLGYSSAEELYQVSAGSLYWYPNDRETFVRRMESEGEVRNDEYVLRRKDGTMLVVVDNGRVVRDKQGRVIGFEGTITDITERKKAETAVFQAKERAQVTLQSIGDAVITTDSEGRIDYMNPVAESLTGWENREAQSQLIGSILTVVDEVTREARREPGRALPARGTGARTRRAHGARATGAARRSPSRIPRRRSATAPAISSAPSWCSTTSARSAGCTARCTTRRATMRSPGSSTGANSRIA